MALLAAGVLFAVHAGFWLLPSVKELMRARFTDDLFGLRAGLESFRPAYDDTIVHVSIDDQSLERLGSPYVGRAEYARLVRGLGRTRVAAQFHDAIFVAPQDPDQDEKLIAATEKAGNVYYGVALGLAPPAQSDGADEPDPVLDSQRWRLDSDVSSYLVSTRRTVNFPALTDAARGLGFLDISADQDGVYRRAPLLARDADGHFPSLPLRILCDYLGVDPGNIELRPGSITLRGARRPGAETTEDLRIPVDRRGRMIVNYVGPWGSMTHYPFATIYEAAADRFMLEDLREELEGKIAIVSTVMTGGGDVGPVPVDAQYPLSGIHANVLNTILTANYLRELPPVTMLWAVELPLLALIVLLALRFSTIPFIALTVAIAVAWVVLAITAFLYGGLILDISGPIVLLVGWTVVLAAFQFHVESSARAVLRSTFESFFPATIVRKFTAEPDRLLDTAHKRELTVLFSDIKSFTSHSANMDPGHVRKLLNEYFEQMIEVVFEHYGTLDKFIGDGLMVFFGDPEPQPDHAARAIRAAIAMQRAARKLAAEWDKRNDMPLVIRVGINTGEMIVGNMGSSRRVSYTVLGEHVNLAQRLEANAPPGGILISARTRELAGDAVDAKPLEPIHVKGFDRPIEVYEVPV